MSAPANLSVVHRPPNHPVPANLGEFHVRASNLDICVREKHENGMKAMKVHDLALVCVDGLKEVDILIGHAMGFIRRND